jgi:hypothetical protein
LVHLCMDLFIAGSETTSKSQEVRFSTNWILLIFFTEYGFIKNVSSSTTHKKTLSFCLYVCPSENLRKFFLTHSFMNWFW